jgi:hypothetical protein
MRRGEPPADQNWIERTQTPGHAESLPAPIAFSLCLPFPNARVTQSSPQECLAGVYSDQELLLAKNVSLAHAIQASATA